MPVLSGLLIFSPLIEGGTTHLAVMVIRLVILLLLSLYVWQGVRWGHVGFPPLRVGPAVLLFLSLAAVSTVASGYTEQSLQWFLVLVSYAGLLYLIVFFEDEWNHVARVFLVLVGMGVFEAGVVLAQFMGLGAGRPTGTFFNPNFLAGYLAAIWAIVLAVLSFTGRRKVWNSLKGSHLVRFLRFAGLIGLLLMFPLAIVCTGSRGGVLAFLVGTAVVLGMRFGRKAPAWLAVGVLCLLFVPNPFHERVRLEHTFNPLAYARLNIWKSSVVAMVEHPFGVGLGLYQYVYPRFAAPLEGQISRYGKTAQTAHNEYLQMGVELGVASIIIFCWGLVGVAQETRHALHHRLRGWQRGLLVGVCAAAASILLHAGVDSNLHEPAIAILLILCVGTILSARRLSGPSADPLRIVPLRTRGSKWAWSVGAILAIAGIVIVVTRLGLAWMAYEKGVEAAAQQEYHQAIAHYRSAIALDPGKSLYHSSMAAALFHAFERTGDWELGRASVVEQESAVNLNPLDGRLFGVLGYLYQSLAASKVGAESPASKGGEGRGTWLRFAQHAYERAVELEPFNPIHRLELGRLYWLQGDQERAVMTVRRATDIEPNFLPAREWLVRTHLGMKQLENAKKEFQEILERRKRYAGWSKDAFEERFFMTDLTGLDVALQGA